MQTIGDLVADARERDATVFATSGGPTDHSYETFLTTAWKAGNLLRHYGVRPGDSVAVAVGPAESPDAEPVESEAPADDRKGYLGTSPTPLLAILGGMVAGASVVLDPVAAVEAKVLVAPTRWLDRFTPGPGTKPIGYGGEVTEATVAQFEREAWSENPVAPPVDLDPTTTAIGGGRPLSHGDLLAETRRIVAEYDLAEGDRVGLAAPIDPGALVAGVLAPIAAGSTVVLDADTDEDSDLDVLVGGEEATGAAAKIDPADVFDGRKD